MKIQNKLGTYLAVTAGVGCAASVAEGAIVVVDLSGLSTTPGTNLVFPGLDSRADIEFGGTGIDGELAVGGDRNAFYSDGLNPFGIGYALGYQPGDAASFPSGGSLFASWHLRGVSGGGYTVGENWVAFRESSGKYGWMSFTLSSLGVNSTNPISSFGKFVYDDTSTGPSNAITLQAAVAAAAAAVPEPSSLALLALGATGLAARRQRKKAA